MNKVELINASSHLSDREKIWLAMRQEKEFTLMRLEKVSGVRIPKIKDYMLGLKKAQIVEPCTKAVPGQQQTYRLIKDSGIDAPRVRKDGFLLPPNGRKRMWDSLPCLGVFDVESLIMASSLADAPVAEREALYYLKWLVRGGYVKQTGKTYQYIPAMRKGAKAPQVLRVKELFDPNTGKTLSRQIQADRENE